MPIRGLDAVSGEPIFLETFQGDGTEQAPYRLARADKIAHDRLNDVKTEIGKLVTILSRTTTPTPISISGAGDSPIVSPTTGKALRICAISFTAASLVTVTFKGGTTAISGAMQLTDYSEAFNPPLGLAIDQPFRLSLGSAVAVNGFVTWYEV
ncbi:MULTISPECIES: hypothetical protein [Trichocoleus]|uniref:Tail fiber protein n=1 Tax=Trichocoleus desertorum GB2-A4 TaxID=2933944 RepID=A0ABV0JCL6_9CYAN|nr:hypothetical protein [Trichocoleus sp. FACHB-46]MBD1864175.1 hypothetical protein [Trichocoleus sp. FACHB-46]